MAMEEKMEIVTRETLLRPLPADHHALDPELGGCCPLCPGCGFCPSCDSCPGCGSCPNCCCCPPCCCPCCPGCSGCPSCPGCDSCPGCGSCPNCCCCPPCCCPCCPGCPGCPGCPSCPGCGCGCPSCCDGCCPPSCDCCCQLFCCLPKLLCKLPQMIGCPCPVNFKKILIILGVVVLIVVIAVVALLFGIFITWPKTETMLQMTVDGPGGEKVQLQFPMNKEEVATFYVDDGTNGPATIVYDFNQLLIGYKPDHKKACYLTRLDKGNVQGVDLLLKEFQTKSSAMQLNQNRKEKEQEAALSTSPVDHSNLSATISILCKHIPIFYT